MSMYDANDIKTANSIMTQLLMSPSHTVNEQYHKELYREYVTNSSVTCLTDLLAENCGCSVFWWGDSIYITADRNSRLGYSRTALREEILPGTGSVKHYYLASFILMVYLTEMYAETWTEQASNRYITVEELANTVSERLEQGLAQEDDELTGIHFKDIKAVWDSLSMDDSMSKKTKKGFVVASIRFFKKEGLVKFSDADNQILPTDKMDRFMSHRILDSRYYQQVKSVFDLNKTKEGDK